MNEYTARQAIKCLIQDNKDSLVEDILALGEQREIVQITTSRLTAEHSYYFVAIYTPELGEEDYSDQMDIIQNETQVIVTLADHIIVSPEDEESFEYMDGCLQVVSDRLVNLFMSEPYYYYTDSEGNIYRFQMVKPRKITKKNEYIPTNWNEDNLLSALITVDIDFKIKEC